MIDPVLPRVAAESRDAMNECVERYGGLVWSIARRMCVKAEVEDAVQDAFVGIWRAADQFHPGKGSETTFVAMIARRRIIDRQRKSARHMQPTTLEEDIAMDSKPSEGLELREEADRARKMMSQLRDDERRVLELAVDGGLSQAEISRRMGLPLGTVKSNARRGLIRLRELLATTAQERSER